MADILASAVVELIVGKLYSSAVHTIEIYSEFQNELQKLGRILKTIQLVLQDAEIKQRKNEGLQYWLGNLKDAVYDAENILDEIATEGRKRILYSEMGNKVKAFTRIKKRLLFRLHTARRVRNIIERFNVIADERNKFGLREITIMNHEIRHRGSRETSSLVNESEIYGRDDEKEMMVRKILCGDEDLSVHAVWGMGGLGKTTLAQLVHNDERIEKVFELRIWVCVSDDFDMKRLLRAILESIRDKHGSKISELDPLVCYLQEKLKENKFFLVLDDVWNEDQGDWDVLRGVLHCGSKGSTILVTTRSERIATMMSSTSSCIHNLGILSEVDSWSLFERRAFVNGKGTRNLVEIGKDIVKKCGGVPLAIKTLASMMQFKTLEREWSAILESEIWQLPVDKNNNILPILRLSYDNLSPQMRQCFAYCCIFPKDYRMKKDELIQLWMANGFLYSESQSDMPLTGHLIFKELVWGSFFQEVAERNDGKLTCKMHDLMHDLALSVMKNETYHTSSRISPNIPRTVRHLNIVDITPESTLHAIGNSLHSIIGGEQNNILLGLGNELIDSRLFCSFASKNTHLRVLKIYDSAGLTNSIFKLEHLRFLVLSCSGMNSLPEPIVYLQNLQTLKLIDTVSLEELPKNLRYMKNLCFVDVESWKYSLVCTSPGLGELTSLQGLNIFIVGKESDHQINQLAQLNLGGDLNIKGLENLENSAEARSANLRMKKNLRYLNLSWGRGKNISIQHLDDILEALQPAENIEKLKIRCFQGSKFPRWMSRYEYNSLTSICLKNCENCEMIPSLGNLTALRILELNHLSSVRRLDAEFYGNGEISFASLKELLIRSMINLEEWVISDSLNFPCLEFLFIESCSKLSECVSLGKLPALKSLLFLNWHSMNFGAELHGDGDCSFPSLSCLIFQECENLVSVTPEGLKHLSSLKVLEFKLCSNLSSFPATILESLPSLSSLLFCATDALVPLSGPLPILSSLSNWNLTIVKN